MMVPVESSDGQVRVMGKKVSECLERAEYCIRLADGKRILNLKLTS